MTTDAAVPAVRHGTQLVEDDAHYDFIVIGSGFGGSVAALRLSEKGYRVLVLEKGRRLRPEGFPKTTWNLKRWLWMPGLGFRGLFKMTFFRHATIFSGTGVGGGSLVYANTLPVPKSEFFRADSWAHLADWEEELAPHYETAQRMLGATQNPKPTTGDRIMQEIAKDIGREEHFESNDVGVYFGEPGEVAPDPFFDGRGPERRGCDFCGACMTGCRKGSKNSLDFNYLYLAEALGAQVQPDTLVTAVRPRAEGGYRVEAKLSRGWFRKRKLALSADQVVFAGGVLGTVDLLLKMKHDPAGLPELSERLGDSVRTNSEALFGACTPRNDLDLSEGVAITSILHADDHSHIEPARYGSGSGFFRLLVMPHAPGSNVFARLGRAFVSFFKRPWRWLQVLFKMNWAKRTQILLYMRTIEGTLKLARRRSVLRLFRRVMKTRLAEGAAPTASMAAASDLAERFADKIDGVAQSLMTETVLGIPSTAHILGGCCIGKDAQEGVIDTRQRVFGYDGLYVVDGAALSANPGVNPALTITAQAERAMSLVPAKDD